MPPSLEHTITFSDPEVRWKYENSFADIRFGQVLEDLDIIAGKLAWDYAQGPVVTAALEQLDFLRPINLQKDLLCKAAINAVGKSSLEVGVRLENDGHHIASAYFTFVALNESGKPRAVAPYIPQTVEEIRRAAAAKQRKEHYQQSKMQQEQPFTMDERELLQRSKTPSTKHQVPNTGKNKNQAESFGDWNLEIGISSTKMYRGANLKSMYPQQTNPHRTIFGGYLMHEALEVAADTVYEYSGQRAVLASINRINFLRPVQIGALLEMHRIICYVGNTSVQVEIVFEELHSNNPQPLTNSCYFAFVGVDENFTPVQMPKVIPVTVEEERKFIDGHRRYQENKRRLRK